MTDYAVGDTVYSRDGGAYEFLGVGFVDDTHYYRRKLDGYVFKSTAFPLGSEYTATPVPAKGQIWHKEGRTTRHVLAVVDDYVVFEWWYPAKSTVRLLSAKTTEPFLMGSTLE